MDIGKKILSDPVCKWVFAQAKKDVYLVGGYVRDLIRGEVSEDKDFILKAHVREIALRAAKKFNGTFIEFKKKRTFRVVSEDGQFIDFSPLRETIVKDLSQRDFTMNAIAWSPDRGIVDPFDGESDLRHEIIRVINPDNLSDDPLRVLRAYRISAQLGLTIEAVTRTYLKKYAPGLKNVAAERITEELIKILTSENSANYMALCMKNNVLPEVIDVSVRKLKLNIISLTKFDYFIANLKKNKFNKLFKIEALPTLNEYIGQGLNRVGLTRLFILLADLDKNKESGMEHLKFSNSVIKRLNKIHHGISLSEDRITMKKLYEIFNAADDCEFELALLLSVSRQRNVHKYFQKADDYVRIKKNKFLNGYDIQSIIHSGPGPHIGKIQAQIQKRRFLGTIRSRAECRRWVLSNFT